MMTGTGYARSRRDKEETREEPAQKREEEGKKAKTRVEIISPPKGTPPIAMVNARHARGIIERAGRGFSLGELSASALSFEKAKKWRVPLDLRRRTALDDNVARLTSWLHVAKPKVETALKAEKPPEPEKPKEEEKPLEVAKPKAQRGLRREEPKEKPVKEPKKVKPMKEPKKGKPAKEEKKEKPVKEPKKVARSKPAKKPKTKTKAKKE